MFRRSRFSIRPNVGTAGRTAATPQEAPSANQEASETPKDASDSSTATAVTDDKSVVTPSEKPTAQGDGNEQNVEGTSSSAALQRRKRFSIKPKVAPGRISALARTPKSPLKAVPETPVEVPVSDLDKPTTSNQTGTTAFPPRLQSPRRRRPSEESKKPKIQPKPIIIPSESDEPSTVPTAETSQKQTGVCFTDTADTGNELESTSGRHVEEVPSTLPDKVPPSLPDKEAIEISEKAKTLVSSKSGLSLSPPALSLSRLLNDPSDLQRLAKARKLRELLKQEMHKEKKSKRANARTKEYTLDPAKMTMRDLIRYLPLSNPMTSSLEENEMVVPPSPAREESPERAQEPEVLPKIASPRVEEEVEVEEEEEPDDGVMVPRVKVAEDGTLIIDEESLTVEVQRAKGPNPAQDRDPIFERGSTTTYSSFRKGTYSKPWSSEETDMFFLAISMVGTDFSMICQLFPHRARSEIKNKFKKEERENSWRIDKAFRDRRKLDIEYFSKLLEKILEVQKNRKKLKSLAGRKSPKKYKRQPKGKKAARKLSVVDEEDEEEQNEIPDLEEEEEEEEEGEKENEDLCNEGGSTVAKQKKKRKRKDASTEEPNDKKNRMGEKSSEQDEAYIPGDTEAALPEDRPTSDMSENAESVNEAKDTTIQPAKLSRGRAPKPVLPLGRKWGKKPPPPSTKTSDTAPDKGDEGVIDGASQEQVNKDASPLRQANKEKSANDDSEEEDTTVQPLRPTRYGRVPKPTKPLNYPAKEAASETTPASPVGSTASAARPKPKCTAKRGRSSKLQSAQESKRPKLVTLRASQSEYSDEEDDEKQQEEEVEEEQHPGCSSSKDSTAPVFVPASLRSPHPVISEVEETMEELDILANMPDVLGISQDALCPDASCERAQNETGTNEPCEHQLDLLVDVIDFLSSENTEVTEDESYNEAAQTLLTIGNLAHLSQSAQNQITIQDHTTETTLAGVNETIQHLEEEIASMPAVQEENIATPLTSATFAHGVNETSETVSTVELQNSTTDNDDIPNVKSSDQQTSDVDPVPQLHSNPESSKKYSPQTRRGGLSKVKPKPNLGQASRTAQSKSQPEMSTVRTVEESHTGAPDLFHSTATEAAEETPKITDCSKILLKDEISCFDVGHTEEPSGSQERSVGQEKSCTVTSDQSASENLSEAQFEPSLEQSSRDSRSTSRSTDESLMSHVGTIESICSDPLTESQTGQGPNIDSATVQKSKDHPAPCVTPVEELTVGQEEESDIRSTHQPRKSRFQKVKPKLNLAQISRTVRSKPQTTKDTIEKDSNPTPNLKFHENTIVEIEEEPTCSTSPDKQSPGPASDLIPSMDSGTTLASTEELSTAEEKKTDVQLVGEAESDTATSHQSASEIQIFSETHFEPSREQASRDKRPTSDSTDEILMSHVGTTESSCHNLLTSDASVTELQIGQGSNISPASVQERGDHLAPCVTPVEELPVSQKEESDVASSTTRKSRFQKVKPKLNLAQISRTIRSKPHTTKDTIEKASSPTANPKFHENTIVEVEEEPTCSTSLEKQSQSPGPASDLVPSLDSGTTLALIEELSTTKDKKTDVQLVGEAESDTASSHQSASEIQNFSETHFEPSREQASRDKRPTSDSTGEILMSHVGTTESSCNNLLKSDASVAESQVAQGSNIDSASVQESKDHPAPCVTPVEKLPVSQKEKSNIGSTCQPRKSRFQKVKPQLNLAQISRTVRSKPQTTKNTIEKDSNPTPNPKLHENTIVEVEAEPTCSTSPVKQSQSPGPASDLIPSLDSGMTSTEELSTAEEKKTDVELVGEVESSTATSCQSASENQYLYGPSREQAARDTTPTSEFRDEVLVSHVETTESSCNNLLTPVSAVTEPVQESNNPRATCAKPIEELPVSQKEETEVKSICQTLRGRFHKVKPKPNLSSTSRAARLQPQTTKDSVTPMQLAEIPSSTTSRSECADNTTAEVEAQPTCSTTPPENPSQIKGTASVTVPSLELYPTEKITEELLSTQHQKTDVGCGLDSNSEGSDQNLPQRRRRFPKVKPIPNLASSPRTTRTKLQSNVISEPSEQCHMDTSLTSEQQSMDNNNAQTEQELAQSVFGPAESEKSLDSINDKDTSSHGVVIATSCVAENQSRLTDSVLENKSSGKPTVEGESTGDKMSDTYKMEAGPASQSDCKQDMSIRTTETTTQQSDDQTAVSDVQSSEDSKTESLLPTNTQSTPDPIESTQQSLSENDSEEQSRDETIETNRTAAQSTDANQFEPAECPSRKAPQARRGRLIKPKPRLGCSSRPPQPRQVQNTNQAEADFGTQSEGVDASVCHSIVSECQPDIQEPVEGAIEQYSNQNSSPNDAGSSFGCLTQVIEQQSQHDPPPNVAGSSLDCVTQVPDTCTPDASTSSTGGTQSHPSLSVFPDMLSRQEPSDPDEPFFILSLTEIPVCSSGEVVDTVPEPLPYLPETDVSVEQQSVPGESLISAEDGPLSNVSVPVPMEESSETSLINVNDTGPDPAACIGWNIQHPVDPHEPAKVQVTPNTTKRKQASKTEASKKVESITILTDTTQHSELPGPSVQPKASDAVVTEPQEGSGDHADVEKETLMGGEDAEDTSSGAQTTRTRRNRKAKASIDPASDSPPGKAASKGSKVRTPCAAGKRSTPGPVASASCDAAPMHSVPQPTEETLSISTTSPTQTEVDAEQTSEHSRLCSVTALSTSPCPAEVSASQQSDYTESSSMEDEPTSVSQYFLSDIFTEVEEG